MNSTTQCKKEESVNFSLMSEAPLFFAPLGWAGDTFQLVVAELGTHLPVWVARVRLIVP